MAGRTEAYVDTSALIAFADRSDTYHPLFRRLFAAPSALVTTALVVAEGHGWFLRRYDRTKALLFLGMIETMETVGFLKVVPVGDREVEAGTDLLRDLADQDLTLVDAVGLHLMKQRRIRSCWSTDHHLGLTGVSLVTHGR